MTDSAEALIESKRRTHWSGKLTLNFKAGVIVSAEVTDKIRFEIETHASRSPERETPHGPPT